MSGNRYEHAKQTTEKNKFLLTIAISITMSATCVISNWIDLYKLEKKKYTLMHRMKEKTCAKYMWWDKMATWRLTFNLFGNFHFTFNGKSNKFLSCNRNKEMNSERKKKVVVVVSWERKCEEKKNSRMLINIVEITHIQRKIFWVARIKRAKKNVDFYIFEFDSHKLNK